MANPDSETYPFTFEAVREQGADRFRRVPDPHGATMGLRGETDDIRQSLFRYLNAQDVTPSSTIGRALKSTVLDPATYAASALYYDAAIRD